MVEINRVLQLFKDNYYLNLIAYSACWLVLYVVVRSAPENLLVYFSFFVLGYGTLVGIITVKKMVSEREIMVPGTITIIGITLVVTVSLLVYSPVLTLEHAFKVMLVYLAGIAGSVFWAIGGDDNDSEILS